MKHKHWQRRGHDFDIVDVPAKFFDLGRRRTAAMLAYQTPRLSLADIAANAYLQGLEDGYFAAEQKAAVTANQR